MMNKADETEEKEMFSPEYGTYGIIHKSVFEKTDLKPVDYAVYCVLAAHAHAIDKTCYISHKRIMRLSGIKSESTLSSSLKRLVNTGLILIEYRFLENGGKTENSYLITPPISDTPLREKDNQTQNDKFTRILEKESGE